MMHTTPTPRTDDLRGAVETMIDLHGPRRVLLAILRATLRPPPARRRRRPPPPAHELGAHLRRDIGLDPTPTGPPRQGPLP